MRRVLAFLVLPIAGVGFGALTFLGVPFTATVAGATAMSGGAKIAAANPAYDVLVKTTTGTNTEMIRDVFAMGGENLNQWPYIEHSDNASSGNIQGLNFVIPDRSRFGWRFITRVSETPYNAAVRATIDAEGNGIFVGSVSGLKFVAGSPGSYTPAVMTWGNHLGGDFLTTLFSSDTKTVQGVSATVFGISYAGGSQVLAQDAFGNLGVTGAVVALGVTAKSVVSGATIKVNGATIASGVDAPLGNCASGDLYLRKSGGAGSTAYTCMRANEWVALSAGPASIQGAPARSAVSTPILVRTPFDKRSLDGSPNSTNLGSVRATLGASNGQTNSWYVCALVEANTFDVARNPGAGFITVGIAAANAGSGVPFRMYSRPDIETNNARLGNSIVSDWLAQPTGTANGRYCSTYASGAVVSFSAYALPADGIGANTIYTSGQVEIQAFPQ